ncbi:MAG: TatD family hydrolase [bacterium]|nr:TatD family hydrolase [bacterium]
MEYIDIHTHLNLAAFNDDREEVLRRTHEGGVGIINVGTQYDTSKAAVEIARRCESGVYASVGLHPIHTTKSFHDEQELGDEGKAFTSRGEEFSYDAYKELAQQKSVVAIGECGLDYYRVDASTKDAQVSAFVAQIALANEVNKPLMLHIRDGGDCKAYHDALEILKSEARVRGNVHFFAGTTAIAKEFLDMGYTLSFTGVITFAPTYKDLVSYVPLSMMHAETDAPYVAPVPHRGKRNEPIFVKETVNKIAEIKREELSVVIEQLRNNARELFGV